MVSLEKFKKTMGLFASGVTVLSTRSTEGRAYGVTVSSFASLSLDPPLVLACLDNRLAGIDHFSDGCAFVVSILSEEQANVSDHFATSGSDRSETSGLFEASERGELRIRNCLASIDCRLLTCYPGGDHTILVGEVLSVSPPESPTTLRPLVYFRGEYRQLAPGGSGGTSPGFGNGEDKEQQWQVSH